MIISLAEIKCPIDYNEKSFLLAVQDSFLKSEEGIKISKDKNFNKDISEVFLTHDNIEIIKKSLDARKKPVLIYVFNVKVYWAEKNRKLIQIVYFPEM